MRRVLAAALTAFVLPAAAHTSDCTRFEGIDKARCERHSTMFLKCGMVKGEAHHECDREYLVANPLQCGSLSGTDAQRCEKENAAFKSCQDLKGSAFGSCVRKTINESPMGH
ncbi:hypothetical protein [Usitatibacter palustris]|uniref:Cysteine rich repeat-containing protein n=1 Tax=Usitatibacter palustris TaxID=2732487 RepID=A0A6M4H694_9PROT|nr:hypothetical protein [Usitatibacter palustris]QJR15161.1 hypothetical protein DSM104440_01978 [Usitatibacter palustris]